MVNTTVFSASSITEEIFGHYDEDDCFSDCLSDCDSEDYSWFEEEEDYQVAVL